MKTTLLIVVLIICSIDLFPQQKQEINMEDAINMAVTNNHGLKAKYQKILFAKGELKENMSLTSPEVGFEFEEVPAGESYNNIGITTYYAEQAFEFPLRYIYKYNYFKTGLKESEVSYQKDVMNLKADARNAYLNWITSLSRHQIAQEKLKIANDFLDQTTKLYDSGEVGKIVLSKSRINLAQAEIELDQTYNGKNTERSNLLTLLGFSPESKLIATDSIESIILKHSRIALDKYDSLTQLDLQLSILKIKQAKGELKYAKSAYMPDLSLRYFNQSIDGKTGFYGAGISLQMPLWFFNQQGKIMKHKSQYLEKVESSKQMRLTLSNKWENLALTIKRYKSNMEKYEQLMVNAEQIAKDSKKAYNEGEISYLEYLDAQSTYLNSKNMQLNIQSDYLRSFTELLKINGAL